MPQLPGVCGDGPWPSLPGVLVALRPRLPEAERPAGGVDGADLLAGAFLALDLDKAAGRTEAKSQSQASAASRARRAARGARQPWRARVRGTAGCVGRHEGCPAGAGFSSVPGIAGVLPPGRWRGEDAFRAALLIGSPGKSIALRRFDGNASDAAAQKSSAPQVLEVPFCSTSKSGGFTASH